MLRCLSCGFFWGLLYGITKIFVSCHLNFAQLDVKQRNGRQYDPWKLLTLVGSRHLKLNYPPW